MPLAQSGFRPGPVRVIVKIDGGINGVLDEGLGPANIVVAVVDAGCAARFAYVDDVLPEVQRNLAEVSPNGDIVPKLEMMRTLRQAETERLVRDLSKHLKADYVAVEPGRQIAGVYDHSIPTPSGAVSKRPHPARRTSVSTNPRQKLGVA